MRPGIPNSNVVKEPFITYQPDKRAGIRFVITVFGGFMVLLAPIVGLLPGPGGIFMFAIGFALMLKNSAIVRRYYARLKAKYPKKANGSIGRCGERARSGAYTGSVKNKALIDFKRGFD